MLGAQLDLAREGHPSSPRGGAPAPRASERGFITRRRDPADRRRHIVELSTNDEDDLLRALSADERATLHGLLVRAAGAQLPTNACATVDEPPPCSG